MKMAHVRLLLLAALFALSLAACGGASPITLNEVPAFPNATALHPGENPIADTLAQNVQQAGAMGAKIDQKIFLLPPDTEWEAVKSFYSKELGDQGWQEQSLPGMNNEFFSTAIWLRGQQSLTVAQMADPAGGDNYLIFSIASQ